MYHKVTLRSLYRLIINLQANDHEATRERCRDFGLFSETLNHGISSYSTFILCRVANPPARFTS